MLHSTNLVQVCRDSGLSGSDIQGLVGALQARRPGSIQRPPRRPALPKSAAMTSIVGLARTLLATLR